MEEVIKDNKSLLEQREYKKHEEGMLLLIANSKISFWSTIPKRKFRKNLI